MDNDENEDMEGRGGSRGARPWDQPRDGRGRWVSLGLPEVPEAPPPGHRRPPFSPDKQDRFFTALAAGLNISKAASAAGVSRSTIAVHRQTNADFRQRFADVVSEAYAELELKLLSMALNGVRQTTTVKRMDDGRSCTVREGDDPKAALSLLQLHHAMVAASEAALDGRMQVARQRETDAMVAWLIAEVEAAEATLIDAEACDTSEGAGEDGESETDGAADQHAAAHESAA